MLRTLYAGNYRSIKSTSIQFGNFNCLVGGNNSGKSNLFDVLLFLSDMARSGLEVAIANHGGDRLHYYGSGGDEPIRVKIVLDGLSGKPEMKLRYEISFMTDPVKLVDETLALNDKNGGEQLLLSVQTSATGQQDFRVSRAGNIQSASTSGLNEPLVFNSAFTRGSDAEPHTDFLRNYLLGIRGYKFIPDRLKAFGPAIHAPTLQRDGSNFASYLHDVYSPNRKYFDQIQDQFIRNFRDIDELLAPLSRSQTGMTEVGIREKWFRRSHSGTQLSDGLVGFLAHLTVLYGPDEPSFVTFEEPENYINPRLLQRLVEMLQEASRSVQVAISTHSTSLLNYLSLEDIIVVTRYEGGTRAVRVADKEALKNALKDWALGDAYVAGALEDDA